MGFQASSISRMLVGTEVAPSISQYDIDGDPYSGFTWINPSMIVDSSTPDIGGSDLSPESSIAEPNTPSQFDAPAIEQSPVACGSFPLFDSFSLSHLYRHSTTFDFDSEDHISESLRNAVGPLDEVFVPTSPASGNAAFEDSDICLGRETAVMPIDDYDEALVRPSIKSLDVGEEPIFNLPSGWKEAFVSTVDVTAPPSSQAGSTKKISVLPRFKSLWKRATSKFVSRSA
jgi:hypothetical protein